MDVCCAFCATAKKGRWDWEPYFWIGDLQIMQGVCPDCLHHVRLNQDMGDCDIAHDFNGMVYRYDFMTAEGTTDTFFFLREPSQKYIDYLASFRPGSTITNCLQSVNHQS